MSRCFPYMPFVNKKKDLPLIGSIELQSGRGCTKQRKELSLHAKEEPNKKRSREEHDKLDSLEHKHKRRRDDAEKMTKFTGRCHDDRKYDTEHLERSDLSEEHNPPCFLLNHCSSLQSTTKGSQKNGVNDPDLHGERRRALVLRLKLPSKKPGIQELVSSNTGSCSTCQVSKSTTKVQAELTESSLGPTPLEKQPFSTITGSTEKTMVLDLSPCSTLQVFRSSKIPAVFTQSTHGPKETSSVKQPLSAPCFSGRVAEVPILQDGIVESDPSKSRHERGMHRRHHTPRSERRFRGLANWNPPPLLLHGPDKEGLDWLFTSRRQSKDGKPKASIFEPRAPAIIPTDTLQPRACCLPEHGMFQLPYVIPF